MSDLKAISRVEAEGDTVRVIAKRWMTFAKPDNINALTQAYEDLFVDVDGKDTVRVGTAAHPDGTDGYEIHGANGIYAEVPLVERDLSEPEMEWCEATFMYSGDSRPESVVEFEIPHPERLRAAILDENLDQFDCLDAVVADPEHRHRVLTTLQEHYETASFRSTKLSRSRGYPIDLPPEWEPDDSHNDDRTQSHLQDMASMRADAHAVDFKTMTGFDYELFKRARQRIHDVHEPWLEDYWSTIAFDVVGAQGWDYCRFCGAVAPAELFIEPQRRTDDGSRVRTCDGCARSDVEYSAASHFEADAVLQAQQERADELDQTVRLERGGEW